MKTEKEIREHRNALMKRFRKECVDLGYGCDTSGHELACVLSRSKMEAAFSVLTWALGEAEGHQGVVDRLNEEAAKGF